jgi:SPP1 family predicted phage head-tail adaptor
MIEAGKLRNRVTIQQYTAAKNDYGEDIKAWTDYYDCWASIEPLTGREYFDSQQIVPETQSRVVIRYKEGVAPTMRVKWGDIYYDILSVLNIQEKNKKLELIVKAFPTT